MNAPCESWTERLSLLAGDCLPEVEAALVRQHAGSCIGCGARLRDLSSLAGRLVAARPEAGSAVAAIMEGIEGAVTAENAKPVLPPEDRPMSSAAWIALATAAIAAGIFFGFAWAMRGAPPRTPESPPIVREERPKSKPAAEPVVASKGRPTLLDYQRAVRESDEQLDALLREDSSLVSLGGPAPRVHPFRLSLDESP